MMIHQVLAPYLSALNLNDNCVNVIVQKSGNSEKPTVTLIPNTKYLSIKNDSKFDGNEKFQITRTWVERENEIIVKGKFPNSLRISEEVVNVLNPAKYFLTVFSEVLDSNSIKINGNLEIKNTPLYAKEICSFTRKFGDIINNLNKTSDNLSAEMTLYALANNYSGKPAKADSGIQFVNILIDSLGLNHNDYRIVDGSGVSHYNVVSTELLVNLLKYFYDKKPKLYNVLYNSFPTAGIDGTLENRMLKTSAQNNVRAKTGSLTGVSALSGYVTTRNKHLLAFSILMQNYVGKSKTSREVQDEICRILAESK